MAFGLGEKLATLLKRSFSQDVEITLAGLLEAMEMGGEVGLLEKIAAAKDQLDKFELRLEPNLDIGDLDTPRVLKRQSREGITPESVKSEIVKGEASNREFKASLTYDHQRAANDKAATLAQLDSDAVCLAAFKTICAFLNAEGGVLIIGVKDDGGISGIEVEFPFLPQNNIDRWELRLRDLIRARFDDGNLVCSLVRCDFVTLDGLTVARISVSPRSAKLSCVREKADRDLRLFVRQGNRTAELKVNEVEGFLKSRV
jgi:hypothetical protein